MYPKFVRDFSTFFLHCTSLQSLCMSVYFYVHYILIFAEITQKKLREIHIKCMKCNILQNQTNNKKTKTKKTKLHICNAKINCIVYEMFICMLFFLYIFCRKPAFYCEIIAFIFNTQTVFLSSTYVNFWLYWSHIKN